MTRAWVVVRQTSSDKQTVSDHRFQAVADLHRWWQDWCQQRRSRRSVEVGIREIAVHYNVLPAAEPKRSHPFFDRCEHGTQFLDECEQCPGGNPVIPDEPNAEQETEAAS